MKEYRLIAWAELPAPYHRTAYRRMLIDMSHRYVSLAQLMTSSSLKRQEAQQFLDALEARGVLLQRELYEPSDSMFGSLRPLGDWLRKALHVSADDQ